MLALGSSGAGQSPPLAVTEAPGSCAHGAIPFDNARRPGARNALQWSLMTVAAGRRPASGRVDGYVPAARLPGQDQGHPSAEMACE
jgi:hypothetical protein